MDPLDYDNLGEMKVSLYFSCFPVVITLWNLRHSCTSPPIVGAVAHIQISCDPAALAFSSQIPWIRSAFERIRWLKFGSNSGKISALSFSEIRFHDTVHSRMGPLLCAQLSAYYLKVCSSSSHVYLPRKMINIGNIVITDVNVVNLSLNM